MDPKAPTDFFQRFVKFHKYCSETKKGGGVIDLGLSLKTIQHESYLPSRQSHDGYEELTEWSQPIYNCNTQLKSEETGNQRLAQRYYNDEEKSRGRLAYAKVHMEGLVVGRKVCLLDQGAYSTLALQLDDMFGKPCSDPPSFQLQAESEFTLVYRDKEGIWRTVGNVPWKEFVKNVDRMRITRRNDALLPF